MFLEYWMIGVLLGVFAYALKKVYLDGKREGYSAGHIDGGVFTYAWTCTIVKEYMNDDVEFKNFLESVLAKGK